MTRHPASLHGVPAGLVPPLLRYYQDATTSCPHLAALRSLRLAIPRPHLLFALERLRCQDAKPGAFANAGVTMCPSLPWRRQDLPSSCETPVTCLHMLQRLRREPLVARLNATNDVAPLQGTQRASARDFRSSITWLPGSLSTLRSAGYPNTTHQLFTHRIPLSQACLARSPFLPAPPPVSTPKKAK